MNFYLDFEATRFSNRIISIGCVAGEKTFSTLVKPKKDKVDRFIKELTGITNEMLEDAPSADEAFKALYDFFETNNDGKPPKYFVYGNCDTDFIKDTMKDMTDMRACMCAQAILGGLIDFAPSVKRHFEIENDVSLRKVFMLIKCRDQMVQKHDALEDALMLQTVAENLSICDPEDVNLLMKMPGQKKPKLAFEENKIPLPEYYHEWNNYRAKHGLVPTGCDENNWVYKASFEEYTMYFSDLDMAAFWIVKFKSRGLSPRKAEHLSRVKININKVLNVKDKKTYGCTWEKNNV